MKIKRYLVIVTVLFLFACNSGYEKAINEAYSKLGLGMAKKDVENLFGRYKSLKTRKILKYPASESDTAMRQYLSSRQYEEIYPKNVFEKVIFDGNIKVFSYLVKEKKVWPYNYIHYIFIFYDEKNDEVIGWGKSYSEANFIKTWNEKF